MMNSFSILYRGNSVDGWISTFIASTALKSKGVPSAYPICANAPLKMNQEWVGTHILLLDLSFPLKEREELLSAGVLTVECIDHHESSLEHWAKDACPINTKMCTSLQVWKHYYGEQEVPFWLSAVDRLSRWDHPTFEDRCIREILSPLSRMAGYSTISEAMAATEQFMIHAMNPMGDSFYQMMWNGRQILEKKDESLLKLLKESGRIYLIGENELNMWKLPEAWYGLTVFALDNTDIVIDSTEASYLVFQHFPQIHIFVNYRKKIRHDSKGKLSIAYLYSARSQSFDLRQGGLFKGQQTSAGTSLFMKKDNLLPFHPPKQKQESSSSTSMDLVSA